MIKCAIEAQRFNIKLWTLRPNRLLIPNTKKEATAMASKPTKVYTVEELKAKCQAALTDPNLVVMAGLTPSQAYDRAFDYIHRKTNDLQVAKKLAVATRWLAMLRRDHREEFEKFVAPEEQPKPPAPEKKGICDFQFDLPPDAELITKEIAGVSKKIAVRFTREYYLIIFLREIIAALREVKLPSDMPSICEKYNLQLEIIQFLEEKFGLKIKTCTNCSHTFSHTGKQFPLCYALHRYCGAPSKLIPEEIMVGCEHWTPVSEKKEN